jgi:uncharacterized Zn finger protein
MGHTQIEEAKVVDRALRRENTIRAETEGISVRPHASDDGVYEARGSKGNLYRIEVTLGGYKCSCPSYLYREDCKHIAALVTALTMRGEDTAEGYVLPQTVEEASG